MTTSLAERLRRLGVIRGARHLQPRQHPPAIERLLPQGQVVHTEHGPFFLLRQVHNPTERHGGHTLGELLNRDLYTAARLARDERLAGVDPERIAFVDTETTGLRGAGTYAFLIGVGLFETGRFVIYQFFMRDYGEEEAQLRAVGQLLRGMAAVVSFNGKGFDLPLLESRFILARQPPPLEDVPHLDLLPVARRLWKYRLASCSLASLEREVLGIQRSQEDIPGRLIPTLYADYIRSGDARPLPRIFYHNAQDILSLVTLTVRLCSLTDALPPEGQIPGEDLYGLGRIWQELGQGEQAEQALIRAATSAAAEQVRQRAMSDLASLLKQQGRRSEAIVWWRRLAESGSARACEELAKHYEWHEGDLDQAITWTQQGMTLCDGATLAAFEHRLARLKRKKEMTSPT